MIRAMFYSPEGELRTDLSVAQMSEALHAQRGLLWVDFENNPVEVDEPILRDTFGFHPLAVDDALEESHVPKIDDWGEYLYIVLHAVAFDRQEEDNVNTLEMDVFLGKGYIITHHDQAIKAVEEVWADCQRDERYLKNGVDHLLYKLTDEIVASYMPVVEALDDEIDVAEDQIFNNPNPHVLENIFTLKRAALHLRRIISPQREVLNKLARDDYPAIDARSKVYFRDVYDHLVRLHDITESLRDLVGGALDTYLSVVNNRMNDIMKTLTIITTLFMPLAFVTGFFGMNFFQPADPLDFWTDMRAFFMTLVLMLLVPITMFLWMRRRGWM